MKVDREAVKVLAIAVGVREAARQTGINENTILSWSRREQWFSPKPQPPSQAIDLQSLHSKPSAALAETLAEHSKATKLGFAKAARKVAEAQAEMPVDALRKPQEASVAKQWTDVAAKAGAWDSEAGSDSPISLQWLSQNTVINVNASEV